MSIHILPTEKSKFEDEDGIISTVSIEYLQNADCSGDDGDETVQKLTLSTRDNGIARFINIKTNSWSIDNVEDLKTIIDDFKKRAGIEDDK